MTGKNFKSHWEDDPAVKDTSSELKPYGFAHKSLVNHWALPKSRKTNNFHALAGFPLIWEWVSYDKKTPLSFTAFTPHLLSPVSACSQSSPHTGVQRQSNKRMLEGNAGEL